MTNDIQHSNGTETEPHPDDHQQAVEACEHALDTLHNGDLARTQTLLDEARAAVERAQYDESGQARRETAWDCYE